MKTKILGTIDEEGNYILLNDDNDFIIETIDEEGNVILNYIEEDE